MYFFVFFRFVFGFSCCFCVGVVCFVCVLCFLLILCNFIVFCLLIFIMCFVCFVFLFSFVAQFSEGFRVSFVVFSFGLRGFRYVMFRLFVRVACICV